MHVTAIIAAGGRGRRLGASVPKQLLELAGRPILQRSVETFLGSPLVAHVVVVVPSELVDAPPTYLRHARVTVVAGGERRQDSVARGLDAAPEGTDVVIVHDAARPLVDAETIERVVTAAVESGAAIAAIAARDTIKQVEGAAEDGGAGRVVARTLPRESIFLAQTPQAFRVDVLRSAVTLGRRGVPATDEAGLAEQAGHVVRLVEGSSGNIKVTTPEDMVIASALLKTKADPTSADDVAASRAAEVRVGSGYDLHRLVEGRPLIIGGVTIPFDKGLAGHSDADVVCHAVIDAMLGAMAAGDIGHHFPDTDPRWQGASSVQLLRQVAEMAATSGYGLVNADVTLIAERPKVGPHRAAIVASLASALGVASEVVGVKAKTNEGVDAVGRGEAMAAHAVVLLERRA